MKQTSFEVLLELAINEDLAEEGDVTSKAIFGNDVVTARLHSKDSGILAGKEYFAKVFARIDPSTELTFFFADGDAIQPGDIVAEVRGKTISILTAERIALNFLGYLSGIATVTRSFARLQQGKTRILDTRKTLPGYRELAKYAVTRGGGTNHRMGLYDMVMIKDNHIDAAGSIQRAVSLVKERWGNRYRIEVECRNAEEVREALDAGADIIMLDNMGPGAAAECLKTGSGNVAFEASGDMSLEKIGEYMEIGLDYISVGKLTHSVKNFDFSLKIAEHKNDAF
ncbi:carboxylating nicotinate-nucleotide diphosphorylase [Marispirochaeta sp.]|jgi:nicotinate-nucleotide pyrophosphorylase (carboxylating)|uniref:carboxylating nicotinate-nucleotide diphosphorylase n=1 Tax=Marispirochaeta sp. TaxID=2038653 RepID=UPI0029C7EAE7|nr:carboxylating nicotinate-nucleotide diphosphorylase [Marispirochaeta sp.]